MVETLRAYYKVTIKNQTFQMICGLGLEEYKCSLRAHFHFGLEVNRNHFAPDTGHAPTTL